jgi:hypothetical protein
MNRVSLAFVASAAFASVTGAQERPRPWALRYAMTEEIADCIVSRNRDAVDSWMRTLPGSLEEERIFKGLRPEFKVCFGRYDNGFRGYFNPTYDPAAIRQGLVASLMEAHYPVLPDSVEPAAVDPAWYRGSTDLQKNGKRVATAVAVNDFGFCLIKSDWEGVKRLVEAATPADEQTSLARLSPLLGGCLPARLKLRIDRDRLRAVITESVLHLLSHQRHPGAGAAVAGAGPAAS